MSKITRQIGKRKSPEKCSRRGKRVCVKPRRQDGFASQLARASQSRG